MTMNETTIREYTIDATGKRLGDVTTQVARYLLGKDSADFARHTVAPVQVTVTNARMLDIPERKRQEIYQRYSGHPGGRKEETLDHLANRMGYSEVVRRSILNMLPKNKLQKPRMKNLIVTE